MLMRHAIHLNRSLQRFVNGLDWRLAAGLGLLLGVAIGLPAFLFLQSAVWGLAWIAVFAGLTWAGYQAEPVLQHKVQLPDRPYPVQDGPLDMVELPGGVFKMGSTERDVHAEKNEFPQHEVQLSRFRIGTTPVTVGVYQELMGGEVPSEQDGQLPMTELNWEQAVKFCNRLSEYQGYAPCYRKRFGRWRCDWRADGYRLPTEAEWEYACRAGSQSVYCFGDDSNDLGAYAWYDKNAGYQAHPVASRRPNRWGLYDMHGNVWEWCWDWYGQYPIQTAPMLDPKGPTTGEYRVLRGGSFDFSPENLRSALRGFGLPVVRDGYLGFRCVRVPPQHLND